MGFAIGSSHHLFQSHFPSGPSSLSSLPHPLFFYLKNSNVETKRKKRAAIAACMRQDDPNDIVFSKKRAVLFVGISVLPFLQLRARALESLVSSESQLKLPGENRKAELAAQKYTPSNPFLSLLNGLGIFGTGVLGALYALARKDKKAANKTIEYLTAQLKEKEAAVVSLEKNFEAKLFNEQEEWRKKLRIAKEEQQALVNELNSAKTMISGLGQELKNEKRKFEELNIQIDALQNDFSKAKKDREDLEQELKEKLDSIEALKDKVNLLSLELKDKETDVQKLSSAFAEKELELNNLNSTYKATKDELDNACRETKALNDDLQKNRKELELKNSVVDELSSMVSSLTLERDESNRKLNSVQEEYNDLKSSSEEKAALDAILLREKDDELHYIKEKLGHAENEVTLNQGIIRDLTQEIENLRKMRDTEVNYIKDLKEEQKGTEEALKKYRLEASDLAKELKQSKHRCSELEAEVSRVQAEFDEVTKTMQKSLEQAKQSSEVLGSELIAVKEQLRKSEEELQNISSGLAAVTENRDSVQKELIDVYSKFEVAANELREEKKVVSSLNKELENLEKQITKDKEARKSLETDLEEATKSLDEMNRNAIILSGELEIANSRISSLEDDKQVLYKSLTEQKNASKEAQENMEDAHNMVLRLGQERENLQKKAKKLEQELASAKGEILRLRSRINTAKSVPNEQDSQKGEAEEKVTVITRRNNRRRKNGSQ